jgi:fructose-1,6-bisphosphatase/inositol monophosphatase family enzyme
MTEADFPRSFVRILAPALRQAAAVANALDGRVINRPKVGELSDAKAALTLADSAAQEALLVPLLEHFGDVRLDAEEDTPSVKRFSGHSDAVVVVDPIDGTLRSYLQAAGPYAVMIGLALEGRFEAALIALPRERLFFDAVLGDGAHLLGPDGVPRRPRLGRDSKGTRRVLVSHGMPEPAQEALRARGYEVGFGCGGAVALAPLLPGVCAGLRLAGPPRGISRRGRIGVLVAREAGAMVRCETGEPFPTDIDAPARALLVAAHDEDLVALREALAAAPF